MSWFLAKKYNSIKSNYLNKSPKEKWALIRNAGIAFLRSTGVPVLDPNFKVYWWSYAAAVVIIDVTISFAYTFWYYAFVEQDTIKGLLNTPLYFGILLPVTIFVFAPDINFLHFFLIFSFFHYFPFFIFFLFFQFFQFSPFSFQFTVSHKLRVGNV